MFNIEFDTDKIGQIKINDFEEKFALTLGYWSKAKYESNWRAEIQKLTNGEKNTIGLMYWMHKPGSKDNYRAWLLYRDGDKVFIQDQLFTGDQRPPHFNEEESLINIPERLEITEDGEKISQWQINISDLKFFIKNI